MYRTLPDPEWVAPACCVNCGYCLTGLTPPGRCPECGTPFLERQLVLFGVPRSAQGTSGLRRLAWGVLIAAAGLYSQTFVFVIFLSWMLAAMIAMAIAAGLVGLLLTSHRERRGRERFVVNPSGLARLPLEDPAESTSLDSLLVPWGGANAVELRRVSGVWYRLRIGAAGSRGRVTNPIFDAGIRCTDALAPAVRQEIERNVLGLDPIAQTCPPEAR